jgi:hypothetical protein
MSMGGVGTQVPMRRIPLRLVGMVTYLDEVPN